MGENSFALFFLLNSFECIVEQTADEHNGPFFSSERPRQHVKLGRTKKKQANVLGDPGEYAAFTKTKRQTDLHKSAKHQPSVFPGH